MLLNIPLNSKTLLQRLSFKFGKIEEVSRKLQLLVENELRGEQKRPANTTQLETYFRSKGWGVKYNKAQIELTKELGKYQIRSLFSVKSPPAFEGQVQLSEQAQAKHSLETTVLIRRLQSSKMMVAHYCIHPLHGPVLFDVQFRQAGSLGGARVRGGVEVREGVEGPNLSMLEVKVKESINSLVIELGVSEQFLTKTWEFAREYEQELYVDWLRSLRSLV